MQLQASGTRYDGQGTVTFPSGQRFTGTFAHGLPHEGTFYFNDGLRYVDSYDEQGRELNG